MIKEDATVGVLTFFSLSRVATFRVDMAWPFRRSVDGRFADGRAEGGLEEVEVAAVIGMLDVAGGSSGPPHPRARGRGLRRLPAAGPLSLLKTLLRGAACGSVGGQ